jgi:hypothetical protein
MLARLSEEAELPVSSPPGFGFLVQGVSGARVLGAGFSLRAADGAPTENAVQE